MLKTRLTLLGILFFSLFTSAQEYDYGMYFTCYPANVLDMSSLVLENNEPIKIDKETTISFDMYVRREIAFGTVFRILTDDKKNIDFLFTTDENDNRYPILAIRDIVHPIANEIEFEEWIPVSIRFSNSHNEISIKYGKHEFTVPYPVTRLNHIKMSFGQCDFEGFKLPDLPSMNIRDIKVFQNNNITRHWKLEYYNENLCYDLINQVPAVAHNPRWLIDEHVTWKNIYSKEIGENFSFAFNPEKAEFYFIPDAGSVIVFNTNTNDENIIFSRGGRLAGNAPARAFYNPKDEQLISYNINDINTSFYSFNSGTWSNDTNLKTDFVLNNSAVFDQNRSKVYSFGGYSYYKYNNELSIINPFTNEVERKVLSDIDPRYSSSIAVVDNTVYIFGGRGCKSGRQELSPHNYYDFYSYNTDNDTLTKIWEADEPQVDFLPAENMIYNNEDNSFYVLSGLGDLLKITQDQNSFTVMSLPIDLQFSGQYVYSNLYYSPGQHKIYALLYVMGFGKAKVDIFSLKYPPLPLELLNKHVTIEDSEESNFKVYIFILLILSIMGLSIYYLWKKKGKKSSIIKPLNENEASDEFNVQRSFIQPVPAESKEYYDFTRSCICLLGGFTVKDKAGYDITDQFTPLLKNLLILLILYTVQNPKGVSGTKLIQFLWFDKSDESAKNNRNVYLSKLKTMMEKIGDIEMNNKNSFWTIRFGDGVICDYVEAMKYFKEINENSPQNHESLYRLQQLLLRGSMLPNTEADWLDNFKSDFSTLTIDILYNICVNNQHLGDEFKLKIADTIFLHDSINEEALYIKCSVLCKNGKKGIARGIYNNFCKEYRNMMDTEYTLSMTEVIDKVTI